LIQFKAEIVPFYKKTGENLDEM